MISTNPDNLFLSDAALSANARREDKMRSGLGAAAGSAYRPAQSSKILCMVLSPGVKRDRTEGDVVYVGESSHVARAVDLKSRTNLKLFKGHTGPVTCLAVESDAEGKDAFLYSGSWDKTIKKWSIETSACLSTFSAHSDFVKSVLLIPPSILSVLSQTPQTTSKLVSSSSDKTIRIWSTSSTSRPEKTLKGHPRGVECLALLFSDVEQEKVTATLMSGGSEGFIHGWDLGTVLKNERMIMESEEDRLKLDNGHETSVYGLAVHEGVFWSVSADMTARRWDSENGFKQDLKLLHPDFVRCIAVHPEQGIVFTGGRDEEIRCWDSTTGEQLAEISGHYGEVTSLIIPPTSLSALLSSSLDGTIRTWDISTEGLKSHAKAWKEKIAEAEEKKKEDDREKLGGLTEEEERELAELMDD